LLFMGAVGKSAQIPLYVWLPDAMEGPTPVSALIHAATMVTAGVYMVARTHVLFERAPATMNVVMLIGLATAFFAATMALTQYDIKRVLAYSTISQLGYMFVAVGVGAYASGMFHLTTHAFFKALLFLGAGSVMHALAGELDLRKMGGLREKMPTTYWTFLVGSLALAGFPLLSGFFSKDEILWEVWVEAGPIVWVIALITAFMTALYTFRMVFMAFWGKSRLDKKTAAHVHESPSVMTVPLTVRRHRRLDWPTRRTLSDQTVSRSGFGDTRCDSRAGGNLCVGVGAAGRFGCSCSGRHLCSILPVRPEAGRAQATDEAVDLVVRFAGQKILRRRGLHGGHCQALAGPGRLSGYVSGQRTDRRCRQWRW
jgi:hypothetical protein